MGITYHSYCYSNNFLILCFSVISTLFVIFAFVDQISFGVVNASTIQNSTTLNDFLKTIIGNSNRVNTSDLQNNPVIGWNLFTANVSLEHNLSPP